MIYCVFVLIRYMFNYIILSLILYTFVQRTALKGAICKKVDKTEAAVKIKILHLDATNFQM